MKNHKIDNIRAFAIMTVVVGHSIILYSSQWGLYEPDRTSVLLDYMKKLINLYQMPLFFSLSGYLFSMTWKDRKFFSFFINKARRLIVPFFAIGMLWMIPVKMIIHYPYYEGRTYVDAFFMLLYGYDLGHLWYLPVLFIIFIILYLAIKFFGNTKRVWSVLLILSALLSVFRKELPPLDGIYAPYIYQYLWSFVFGAFISQYKLDRIVKNYAYAIGAIAAIWSLYSVYTGRQNTIFLTAVILIAVYALIPDEHSSISEKISKNSFGIYLIHSPLIYITFTYLLNTNPLIVCVVNFFIFGTMAYYMTELIRNIHLGFVIGE